MKLFIKASHKYIRKYRGKNGQWVYVYPNPSTKRRPPKLAVKVKDTESTNDADKPATPEEVDGVISMLIEQHASEEGASLLDVKAIHEHLLKLILSSNKYTEKDLPKLAVGLFMTNTPEAIHIGVSLGLEPILGSDGKGNLNYVGFNRLQLKYAGMNLRYMMLATEYDLDTLLKWSKETDTDKLWYDLDDMRLEWVKDVSFDAVLKNAIEKNITFKESTKELMTQTERNVGRYYLTPALREFFDEDTWERYERFIESDIVNVTEIGADLSGVNNTFKGIVASEYDHACIKPVGGEKKDLRRSIPTGTFAYREASAYIIDKAFGFNLVPMTAVREVEDMGVASVQKWEEGVIGYKAYYPDLPFDTKMQGALFDFLVYNTDRHDGNFLLDGEKLVYIDNGLILPEDDTRDSFRSLIYNSLGDTPESNDYLAFRGSDSFLLPDELMDRLDNVDIEKVITSLRNLNISEDALDQLRIRFEWVLNEGRLPSTSEIYDRTWRNQ